MRALLLDEEAQEKIARCRRYAEENRLSMERILQLNDERKSPGEADPNYLCEVRFGYRICFTIEQQQVGWCRHISISVDTPGMFPNVFAVDLLLSEFGFRGSIQRGGVIKYLEAETAINVLELFDVIETDLSLEM
jgi:hypothetical protein